MAALVYLEQGDAARAGPEVESLQQAMAGKKGDPELEYRLWETQGLLQCQTGSADEGLKLLAKAADRSKRRLRPSRLGQRRLFHGGVGRGGVALRPDGRGGGGVPGGAGPRPGERAGGAGVAGAVRTGRADGGGAARYADLAHHNWARADAGRLEAELALLRDGRYAGQTDGEKGRRRSGETAAHVGPSR